MKTNTPVKHRLEKTSGGSNQIGGDIETQLYDMIQRYVTVEGPEFLERAKISNNRFLEIISELQYFSISKLHYDVFFDEVDKQSNESDYMIDKINSTLSILDAYKSTLEEVLQSAENYKQTMNQAKEAVNNAYLNSQSKLSQLALAKLPPSNQELIDEIENALTRLNIFDTTEREPIVQKYMAAVEDVKKNRGGSNKIKTRRHRTKTRRHKNKN